jgi:hypothetical protein
LKTYLAMGSRAVRSRAVRSRAVRSRAVRSRAVRKLVFTLEFIQAGRSKILHFEVWWHK